jgi:hypothetical protein
MRNRQKAAFRPETGRSRDAAMTQVQNTPPPRPAPDRVAEARRFIDDYYRQALPKGGRAMTGQLTDSFQQALRDAHADLTEKDCHFYHTLEFADGRVVPGGWDLRGKERAYLGLVDYRGARVLEFGPATGHLGFTLERQGAELTCFDLAPGAVQDLLPLPGVDLDAHRRSGTAFATEVRNSWWYGRRRHGSRAVSVYGDIYQLPGDIGRYDVAVLCSILLHLSNPFAALRQAAAVADKAVVVTDVLPPVLYGGPEAALLEFNPGEEAGNLVNWWGLSPGVVARMLRLLGFPHITTRYHAIDFHRNHDPSLDLVRRFMFTVIAEKSPGAVARLAPTPAELAGEEAVRKLVPVLTLDHLKHHAELYRQHEAILNSFSWRLTRPLRGIVKLFKPTRSR